MKLLGRDLRIKYLHSHFVKNIGILVTGSFFAQIIVVLLSPLLTRLFPVEEIGRFSYFLSIAQTFMGVACLRYDIPIVSEKEESKVDALIKLCLLVTVSMASVVSLSYAIYALTRPDQTANALIIAVFLFFALISYGVVNALTAYNNRRGEYKTITTAYFIRTVFHSVVSLLLGLVHTGAMSLLIPYIFGQFLGVRKQAGNLKEKFREIFKIPMSEVKAVAKEYRNLPLYSTPAIFANTLSYSSISIFMGKLYGLAMVGYYSMSIRILGLPLLLFSGNVSKVFFRDATLEYRATGCFKRSYLKTLLLMSLISVPFVLIVMMTAPTICGIAFGKNWVQSGIYMQILMPMFGIRIVASTLTPGFQIVGKQKLELGFQSGLLLATVFSYFLSQRFDMSVEQFLMSINWTMFIVYFGFVMILGFYAFKHSPSAMRPENMHE